MRLKRLISAFITCAMLVTFMPMQAFATDSENLTPDAKTSADELVTVQKTAARVGDQKDTYEITLSVKTKDGVTPTPAASTDVVLVIDASGSMNEKGKLENAQKAAEDFAEIVLGKEAQGENHIAVVSYAENASTKCGLSDKLNTVENAIDAIRANGGTNIQAGIKAARDLLNGSAADNKVILVLSDGEPTYSFQEIGTGTWYDYSDKWGGGHRRGKVKDVVYTGFDYNTVIGSGSDYSLTYGSIFHLYQGHSKITATCTCGKDHTKDFNVRHYENNGDPTIAEARYAKDTNCKIYSIYLGGKNDTNAQYTMKGIASGEDHFATTDKVEDLAALFKGIA